MDRTPLATGPIVWVGIIATTCLLLLIFQTALWLVVPFFLAVIFYYLLSPAVRWAMGRGLSRSRSVAAVTVVLWTVIGLISLLAVPKASRAVHNWPARFGDYVKGGADLLVSAQQTVTTHVPLLSRAWMSVSPDDMEKQAADWAAHNSGGIALQLLHWIPSLLLVPYLTYFFLLDGPRFKRFVVQAIPNAFFEKALYLFYRMEDQLRRYFQGLLTLTRAGRDLPGHRPLGNRAALAVHPGRCGRRAGVAALSRLDCGLPDGGAGDQARCARRRLAALLGHRAVHHRAAAG